MAKRASDLVQVKIRMPAVLHRKLTRGAGRTTSLTINAEIVRRLETSFQSDRILEAIFMPHNAKLVRMIGMAALLAGDWLHDGASHVALQFAILEILHAHAPLNRIDELTTEEHSKAEGKGEVIAVEVMAMEPAQLRSQMKESLEDKADD